MTVAVPIKSLTLDQLTEQIKPHLEAMDQAEESALIHAKKAGRWLKLAKARCQAEHHIWDKWVPRHFNKSKQMADGYIRIFDHWSEIEAEMNRSGKGMSVRAALDFLSKSRQQQVADEETEPAEKKKQKLTLNDQQKEALRAFLDARGVQADPVSFISTLLDLDINLKKIVNRLDILAIQLTQQKLGEWLNSFQDGYPAWHDACQVYGLEPEVMAAAAEQAGQQVYAWHAHEWSDPNARPGPEYDMLIAGINHDWYYFVNGQAFKPDEVARKTAEWLVESNNAEEYVGDELLDALQEKLAALLQPQPVEGEPTSVPAADAPSTEEAPTPTTEVGPAGAVPPEEEPPTPSPKKKRR